MAWTSPRTWVTSETVTATIMNAHVRDNFSETAPAKVTTAGDIVYATASNTIARLAIGTSKSALVSTGSAPRWSSTGISGSGTFYNVDLSNTMTATANNAVLATLGIGTPTYAKSTFTGLVAVGVYIEGTTWATSGSGTIDSAFGAYINAPSIGTANWAIYVSTGNSRISDGKVFINDTSDANLTKGLVINQGTSVDKIITLKQSNVAHGMTGNIETDTFGYFSHYTSNSGGLHIGGVSESTVGIALDAATTTSDTTKSTAAVGNFTIIGYKKSGSAFGVMGANENIVATYDGFQCRHILDSDGDSHQDVGTAWTNFDAHDDADLLTALSVHVSQKADPIRGAFKSFLKTNRAQLEALKLVTFNRNGHHFVNMSRLTMLLVGAVRQAATRIADLGDRLTAVEHKLLLTGV